MRKNSSLANNFDSAYYLEYERCIKQHHYSPKIFICIEENCQQKSLLCHYCVNNTFNNQSQQNFNINQLNRCENQNIHNGHKILPTEEYINMFRNLYFNAQHSIPSLYSSQAYISTPKSSDQNTTIYKNCENQSSSTSINQEINKDWKETTRQKYLKYLQQLKYQISEIYQFVEIQIQETEQMILNSFQNISQFEKEMENCFTFFDNKEQAVSSVVVKKFINTSLNFLKQSINQSTKNACEYVEFNEYSSQNQPISLITQKDIQANILKQFNQIQKVSDYFKNISNDIHKQFSNGLLNTPFFQSQCNLNSYDYDKQRIAQNTQQNLTNQFIRPDTFSNSNFELNLNENTNFVYKQNIPEDFFSIKRPSKQITSIHKKSIWRIIHLYKSVCASCSSDGTIKIWDFKTQKILKTLNSFNDAVNDIIYIQKQKLLISVSGDNKIRVFSLNNYKCIHTIEGHLNAIYTCHYDPIKNLLLSAGREEEVYGWNIITGQRVFKTKSIKKSIYSLQSFSQKDSFLCGDESGSLTIFNYNNPSLIRSQSIHSKTIYQIKAIQIFGNNKDIQIITCSADEYIKITSFETLEILNQIKLNSLIYEISIYMNRIIVQIGKTENIAIIGLTQQRGNTEITTKIKSLSNPHKIRCLQIIKDQNILLYESTQNEISFDMNIQQL